jgi:hypothetical protein
MGYKINQLLALIAAILAIGLGFLYWNYAKVADMLAKNVADQEAQSLPPANAARMTFVSVAQSDNFYNIQAEYPQFDDADLAFNQKIAATVTGQITAFEKEARDNFNARNATLPAGQPRLEKPEAPFDFIAAPTMAQFGPDYESFMIDVYYFSGGAHGIDQIFAFNYDLKNKKEINLADFLGSADNLSKLASLAQGQVLAQAKSNGLQINDSLKQMISDGTAPTPDNYRNFTFGYGKLTVYFEQYQAGPGSSGTITAVFYKNELDQNSIKSGYLR